MITIDKLVRKAQKGDKAAFVRLIEENQLPMYRTAAAILHNETDAEDAVQEAVCRAFYKISSLKQPKYFKTWLTRIVINCCYDILRQQKGLFPMEILPEEGYEDNREFSLDVQETMRALSENDRLILTLYYINDMPVKDIAKLLGISDGAAKMRLSTGRKKFRETYESREKEAGTQWQK